MTLQSFAEELIVLEPEDGGLPMFEGGSMHEHMQEQSAMPNVTIEISQNPHENLETEEFVLSELPGADEVHPIPEPKVELVVEEEKDDKKDDENDAKNAKSSKWNWSAHGAEGFVDWVKERFSSVPKHSGIDTAGLDRTYLEKLDNEISKAMRLDLDGEIDADKVATMRDKIDDGIARLNDRIKKIKQSKKPAKKKADSEDSLIIKEAQKIVGVQGIYITVPLMISRIARVCINGTISAGKDIEHTYREQVKKWKLDDREAADVAQLIFDMGYAIRMDRGLSGNDDLEVSSEDNYDFSAQFSA